MNNIFVVGLGPGNMKYITPAAVEALEKSSVIAGGRRNLESLEDIEKLNLSGKELFEIKGPLENTKAFIESKRTDKTVSVIASGDPGFYGILAYMKRTFGKENLTVIPGISAIQYLFAKIGMVWHDAHLGSVHGRDEDVVAAVTTNEVSLFLTDKKNSYRFIAETLCNAGLKNVKMYVGSNLSYENEEILEDRAENILNIETDANLAIVVVENENR